MSVRKRQEAGNVGSDDFRSWFSRLGDWDRQFFFDLVCSRESSLSDVDRNVLNDIRFSLYEPDFGSAPSYNPGALDSVPSISGDILDAVRGEFEDRISSLDEKARIERALGLDPLVFLSSYYQLSEGCFVACVHDPGNGIDNYAHTSKFFVSLDDKGDSVQPAWVDAVLDNDSDYVSFRQDDASWRFISFAKRDGFKQSISSDFVLIESDSDVLDRLFRKFIEPDVVSGITFLPDKGLDLYDGINHEFLDDPEVVSGVFRLLSFEEKMDVVGNIWYCGDYPGLYGDVVSLRGAELPLLPGLDETRRVVDEGLLRFRKEFDFSRSYLDPMAELECRGAVLVTKENYSAFVGLEGFDGVFLDQGRIMKYNSVYYQLSDKGYYLVKDSGAKLAVIRQDVFDRLYSFDWNSSRYVRNGSKKSSLNESFLKRSI